MISLTENRDNKRHKYTASIVYAYYNSDIFYNAKMCNFGNGGMCFKTSEALKQGADIYIMAENFSPKINGFDIYEGYLAEVRWCKKNPNAYSLIYKAGVKFCKPILFNYASRDHTIYSLRSEFR